MARFNGTAVSVTNGEGITITGEQVHDEPGQPQGTKLAQFTVTGRDGLTIGFKLCRENRRRLRALIDMMDI
jgi:hypothetical protein